MYEGLLACADCPGIHTQLTLEPDGGFEIVTQATGPLTQSRPPRGDGSNGRLATPPSRSVPKGAGQRFAVGEGRLLLLETGQTQPAWDRADATLPQSSPAWRSTRQDLGDMLEDHRWMLVDGTDAGNRRIDALFPDAERSLALYFAGPRLHVQGGCNGFRGAVAIDADGMTRRDRHDQHADGLSRAADGGGCGILGAHGRAAGNGPGSGRAAHAGPSHQQRAMRWC
jgi:hypothetical protein